MPQRLGGFILGLLRSRNKKLIDARGLTGQPGAGPATTRELRTNRFLAARLETASGTRAVTVRNLSEHGALIEGSNLPATGTAVRLVRDHLVATGTVVWNRDRRCGLRLLEPIVVDRWMAKNNSLGQATIETALALVKPEATIAALAATDPAHRPSLARSVELLEAQLKSLSDSLIASPYIVARHTVELQALDALTQGLVALRARLTA